MVRKCVFSHIVAAILLLATAAMGQVLNGSFEDFNDVTFMPTDWNSVNVVFVVSTFTSDPQRQRQWLVNEVNAVDGQYFVMLGTAEGGYQESYVYQTITITSGQELSFFYFFGTYDYMPYNDWASIRLTDINNPAIVIKELFYIDVNNVNSYGSTDGWRYFSHVFTEDEEGTYNLELFVSDCYDSVFESFFAVDGLQICLTEQVGNLNDDCTVDFADFGILSSYWQQECYEPNCPADIADPNDDFVDSQDLQVLTTYWLRSE
ncbi:MAG: hypothetical protein PHF37_00655 [Phycisphaerae bacterium]|nr:hypothetical protein [Phycisphaerae bacterium]